MSDTLNNLNANNSPIPYTDFGGDGPALHFYHANGYPPKAYAPLLQRFTTDYHVTAMHARPLWGNANPEEINHWGPFVEDLITFLEAGYDAPVVGMGHSVGATTTLLAALRRPDLFSAVVLLDPVIFPPWFGLGWRLVWRLGLAYRLHPLVPAALKRRRVFESQQAMFNSYRKKEIFSRISDDGLWAYIRAITRTEDNGRAVLTYPAEWEARIYVTGIFLDDRLWKDLHTLQVPLLLIYGERSDAFWESSAQRVRRHLPEAQLHRIPDATHLVPLEYPEEVSQITLQFLRKRKQGATQKAMLNLSNELGVKP